MESIPILLFVSILVGIGLVIVSLIAFTRNEASSGRYLETDNTIKAIDQSIGEAEKTMEELSQFSSKVFEEIDNKYQELLFLYHLLDEKKKDIMEMYRLPQGASGKPATVNKEPIRKRPELQSPKVREVFTLKEEGRSVSEIAKALGLGQGEVKLMLELYKS